MPRNLLITGCSSGIGEACALHFDRAGWRVFAGVRREEDARRLTRQASERLQPLYLDVTRPASIAVAAGELSAIVGDEGLQGLVNTAGTARGGPLEFVPLDAFRQVFEVNVFGLLAVTQAVLPALHTGRGRIVNIGSVSGRVTTPLIGPYCASKYAVESMSDALRLELLPHGLYASVIEPGVVRTPIWDKAIELETAAAGQLPEAAHQRYGTIMRALFGLLDSMSDRAIPVERVVQAVEHALASARPRPRYLLGRDAWRRVVLQALLPRRWMDAVVLWYLRRLALRAA